MFNIGYAYYCFGNSSGLMKTSRDSEQEKFLKHWPGETEENREVRLSLGILTRYVPNTMQRCYSRDCDVRPASFPNELRSVLTGHRGFFLVYLKTSIH